MYHIRAISKIISLGVVPWVGVGGFSKEVATFNHVGGSFSPFMATTGDVLITTSFRIWDHVLHVVHISCLIPNCSQHQWVIPSLNSSLGFAGGKHCQKITLPIFRRVPQNFAIPGYFPYILFYRHLFSLLSSGWFVIVRRAGLLWSQQDFEWRWSVPLFKCLTVLEFSFILFDLCLLITFFNFIMNYVHIITFWIFTYHKIWILSIMFCFIWSYWIIYFLACL